MMHAPNPCNDYPATYETLCGLPHVDSGTGERRYWSMSDRVQVTCPVCLDLLK